MERQGERAAEQAPAIDQAPPVAAPEQAVLSLQRKIGNRAVTALVARDENTSGNQTEYSITLDGIGTIPLESLSWGSSQREGKTQVRDVSVSSKTGKWTTDLMKATANGDPIKTGSIVIRKGTQIVVTIELKDIVITSFQTGGSHGDTEPIDSWSMSVGAMKIKTGATKESTGAEWDPTPSP